MGFSFDTFLKPLTTTDRGVRIYEKDGDVKYIINPWHIKSIGVTNNLLKIRLEPDNTISLDFSTENEANLALSILQPILDQLLQKNPEGIGTSGTSGVDGPRGFQGIQGESGTSGTSGVNGLNGEIGLPGPQGPKGVDGNNGLNGTSGTSGLNGKDAGSFVGFNEYYNIPNPSLFYGFTHSMLGPFAMTEADLGDGNFNGSGDDGYYKIDLPFDVNFLGITYSTIYIGTNSYLTFGLPSSVYSSFSQSNPGIPGIFISSGDRSINAIYTKYDSVNFYVRYEGYLNMSGDSISVPNPEIEWEIRFSPNGTIDVNIGNNFAHPSGFSMIKTANKMEYMISTNPNTGFRTYRGHMDHISYSISKLYYNYIPEISHFTDNDLEKPGFKILTVDLKGLRSHIRPLVTEGFDGSTFEYDFSKNKIWFHNSVSQDYIAKFIKIYEDDDCKVTAEILINQDFTGYKPYAVDVEGTILYIKWQVGADNPSSYKMDYIKIELIKTGGVWVYALGQIKTFS
jgi:hypothetical protein